MPGPLELLEQWLKGEIDAASVLDFAHYELHEGNVWRVDTRPAELADATPTRLNILTGAKQAHVGFMGACGGDAVGYIFEGPTYAQTGAVATPVAMNRAHVKIPTTQVWAEPVVNASGTYLLSKYIPGGQKNAATGGEGRTELEIILHPNTFYYAFMINIAGQAKNAQVIMQWYEHNVKLPKHANY